MNTKFTTLIKKLLFLIPTFLILYGLSFNSVEVYADYTISMTSAGAHSIDVTPKKWWDWH